MSLNAWIEITMRIDSDLSRHFNASISNEYQNHYDLDVLSSFVQNFWVCSVQTCEIGQPVMQTALFGKNVNGKGLRFNYIPVCEQMDIIVYALIQLKLLTQQTTFNIVTIFYKIIFKISLC